MNILNFGSVNIDSYFKVDHIARPGETISSISLKKKPGGKGLNQSIALKKVYDNLYHAGLFGNDGEFIKNLFEENSINTKFFRRSNSDTGNALIQVDKNGENSIVLYKGANFDIDEKFVDEVLDYFSKDDVLVLQNEISSLSYIVDKAKEKRMKIVLNPSPINEVIFNLDFSKLDLLVLNETEAKDISKFSNNDEIIEFFRRTYPDLKVILTLGANGSIYFDKDELIKQKAYIVNTVDTTGAGDTFMGFFVGSYYKGDDIKKAMDLASIASALACMKDGASTSIPSIEEVKKFRENLS
ncbi:ribokinase [Anaerococcus porci]|uniref:Ribokinase n=1 Tax=Anaerococcus porci TaxID=2652269 RepID=A0A6N7VEH3_9FIRM|nr:ribokinase [Anaerococcus porci]MDY3005727.1 ribokinase [Anaerococcus porci]MSS77848.1 ribokinase [Anaerococcus porci]